MVNKFEEETFLFRSSRKYFRLSYYLSSLAPSFLLLVVYMFLGKLNDANYQFHNIFINIISIDKIVFLILFLALIISFFSLFRVKAIIDSTKDMSNSNGTFSIQITERYNQGFRDFIMSVLVPFASTFSIMDQPIATIVILLLIQFLTYKFYVNSSDIYPNIALAIWGYSVFVGYEKGKNDSVEKKWYVFGKTKAINSLIISKQNATALGDPGFKNNNIAIIIGG